MVKFLGVMSCALLLIDSCWYFEVIAYSEPLSSISLLILVIFTLQDLHSQLKELIPEQQVCVTILDYDSCSSAFPLVQ